MATGVRVERDGRVVVVVAHTHGDMTSSKSEKLAAQMKLVEQSHCA